MELAKEQSSYYCIDSCFENNEDDFKMFENLALSFLTSPLSQFKSLNELYKNININFEELKVFSQIKENLDNFNTNIQKINDINSLFIKELKNYENLKPKNFTNLIQYMWYLNLRLYFYLVSSNNFSYENEWPKTYIMNFFHINKAYKKLTHKESPNNITSMSITIPKETFTELIGNFQNYLTIYLFDITSNIDNEEDDYSAPMFDREEMEHFMEAFDILWFINLENKIVHFKLFNNETASKNFDINEDCKIYINNFNKKKLKEVKDVNKMMIDSGNGYNDEDSYKFSLINYNYLFDSSRKSDILYAFNYKKQRQEVMSSLTNILSSLNNPLNFQQISNLLFEVRRTHLIEDTMNLISNPQFNLKKQLRVYKLNNSILD